MSGLQGKALQGTKEWPTKQEVFAAIPDHLLKRDTGKSMMYAASSAAITALCVAAGTYIPMSWAWAPVWMVYGAITGTAATGMWVVAHECGHRAFSDNTKLQNTVGYIFHTLLLVPYFSWQRSHAVHHARTNHLSEGETHVPYAVTDDPELYTIGEAKLAKRRRFFAEGSAGRIKFGFNRLWSHLVFGWPAYLLAGSTGGPIRGKTNHFLPTKGTTGKNALFPGKFAEKVYWSDYGIAAMLGALGAWGAIAGWQTPALLYFLPIAFTNMWLVLYTWLQHTDVDVPHFDKSSWTWSKGTFMTIDRPYGPVLNFLHHGIGSTHVVHHINHEIPHYNAWEATEAIKKAFPDLYLYDPTPIHEALWRVSTHCVAVEKKPGAMGAWVFNTSLKEDATGVAVDKN